MIDKALRVPKEEVLAPIASRFLRHVHPTTVTFLAFGAGVASCVAVWQQAYGVGISLWLLNRVLDGLDGTVARVHDKQSDFGAYLDIVLDTAIYALIPSAIVLGAPSQAGWCSLLVLLISFLSTRRRGCIWRDCSKSAASAQSHRANSPRLRCPVDWSRALRRCSSLRSFWSSPSRMPTFSS